MECVPLLSAGAPPQPAVAARGAAVPADAEPPPWPSVMPTEASTTSVATAADPRTVLCLTTDNSFRQSEILHARPAGRPGYFAHGRGSAGVGPGEQAEPPGELRGRLPSSPARA